MASSVNKVIIVGNLGGDPEIRYAASGKAIANFNVATSETWGAGEAREQKTEWHRIVVFDKLAELCGQFLTKGQKVYVEGKLQTRQWQDKDNQTRTTTEIVAREVVFLSSGAGAGAGAGAGGGAPRRQATPQREEGGYGGGAPATRPAFGGGRQAPPQSEPAYEQHNPTYDDDDIPF